MYLNESINKYESGWFYVNDPNKVGPAGTHKYEYININHDTNISQSQVPENYHIEAENDATDNQIEPPLPSTIIPTVNLVPSKQKGKKRKKQKKERKHKCSFCTKMFFNKQDRECHVNRRHKFMKPYSCHYNGCNKEFYGARCKRKHQKKYHAKWYEENKQNGIKLVHYNPKEENNRNKQPMIKKEKYNEDNMKSPDKSNDEKISRNVIIQDNDTSNNKSDDENKHEMREMQKICNQLELRKGVYIKFHVYGYSSHLAAYKDIVKIVEMTDNDERKMYINNLNSCKLRDIQSKIASEGKCGKKQDMIEGVVKMLPKLQASWQKNMMNTENDNINNIEQEENSRNNMNCDASPNITDVEMEQNEHEN